MDSNNLVLIIILIAVVLALVLSLIALISAKKASDRSHNIGHIAREEIRRYMGFEGEQRIKSAIRDELSREQQKNDGPKQELVKSAETVVNTPEKEEKPMEVVPAQEAETEKAPVEITLPEPVTFYTGICKEGAFKHVTTAPDSKTIFTIYAESKDAVNGILNVDQSAYDKIAQTPDYLQNACVYSGNGTQLKITKTGTVQKENGTWVVKEPIVAEFN
ncbi:MAG: hypothetical protein J6S97_09675 [Bacteroidales bacterium]|nr:hypothetical protein [Bacteroidales bacterium]